MGEVTVRPPRRMFQGRVGHNAAPPIIGPVVVVALLNIITLVIASALPKAVTLGEALFTQRDFAMHAAETATPPGFGRAVDRAGDEAISIRNDRPDAIIGLRAALPPSPPNAPLYIISTDLRAEALQHASAPTSRGRVFVDWPVSAAPYDMDKNYIARLSDEAPRGWRRYAAAVDAAPGAELVVELNATTGLLAMRDLAVYAARPNAAYDLSRFALMTLWAVAMAGVAFRLLASVDAAWRRLALGAGALATVALPVMSAELRAVMFNASDTDVFNSVYLDLSTRVHFVLFAGFAALVAAIWPRLNFMLALVGLFLFAATSESLQAFLPGRTPSLGDLGVNSVGLLFGFGFGLLARSLVEARALRRS